MVAKLDNIASIITRNNFYQINYRRILIINLLLVFTIFVLAIFLWFQESRFSFYKYFPTTPDGKIINSPKNTENHLLLKNMKFNKDGILLAHPEINIKDLDLTAADSNEHAILKFWVKKALLNIFELDYVNYREVIKDLNHYFTAGGYNRFIKAFYESNNLRTIKNRRCVAYAILEKYPKVVKTGVIEDHKVWQLTVPIIVYYESKGNETLTQKLLAILNVARISTIKSPFYGLGIYQINFKTLDG